MVKYTKVNSNLYTIYRSPFILTSQWQRMALYKVMNECVSNRGMC
jgi:hypothetical protein